MAIGDNRTNPAHDSQYTGKLNDSQQETNSKLMVYYREAWTGDSYSTDLGETIYKAAAQIIGTPISYANYEYNGGSFANLLDMKKSVKEYGNLAMEENSLIDLEYTFQLPTEAYQSGQIVPMSTYTFLQAKYRIIREVGKLFYASRMGTDIPDTAQDASTAVRAPIYFTADSLSKWTDYDPIGDPSGQKYMVEAWFQGFTFNYNNKTVTLSFKHKSYAISTQPDSINFKKVKSGNKIGAVVNIKGKIRPEWFRYNATTIDDDLMSQYRISELTPKETVIRSFEGAQMTSGKGFALRTGESYKEKISTDTLRVRKTPEQIRQYGAFSDTEADRMGAHASGMPEIMSGHFSLTTNDRWSPFRTEKADLNASMSSDGQSTGSVEASRPNAGVGFRIYNLQTDTGNIYQQISKVFPLSTENQRIYADNKDSTYAEMGAIIGPNGESAYYTFSPGRDTRFVYNVYTNNHNILDDWIDFVYLASSGNIMGVRIRFKKAIRPDMSFGFSRHHPRMLFGARKNTTLVPRNTNYARFKAGEPTAGTFATIIFSYEDPFADGATVPNDDMYLNLVIIDIIDTSILAQVKTAFKGAIPIMDFAHGNYLRSAFNISPAMFTFLSANGDTQLDAMPSEFVSDSAFPDYMVYRTVMEL